MKRVLFLLLVIIGCTDKKEYSMDVELLKSMVADHLNKNDVILKKMDKEVHDNGMRPSDTSILFLAKTLISNRNSSLNTTIKTLKWSDEIIQQYTSVYEKDHTQSSISNFYSEILKKDFDSLAYYKFLLSILPMEEKLLNYYYGEVSAINFFFNCIPHVLKTADTIKINEKYEFTVIPDYYDYKRFKSDLCTVKVYKRGNIIEIPANIIQTGNAFIISIQPQEGGNYKAVGNFVLKDKTTNLKIENTFLVEFVVQSVL